MIYTNLKKIVKNFHILWKFLVWCKNCLINLSRLKDVVIMMILFHVWPEHTYRFSTRKFLPSRKNRFSKKSRPAIPYDLMVNKSSNIPKMKEINIIGRGLSFDLNNIQEINDPIFLLSFWAPLKIDDNGEMGIEMDLEEYMTKQSKIKDYTKKNITYVGHRKEILKMLKKRNHNILNVLPHYENKDGNLVSIVPDHTISSFSELFENRISVIEKICRPTLPYPFVSPTGSFFPVLCALSYFAEKINVYGWDFYLKMSPEKMKYTDLFLSMYNYKHDKRSRNHFESALINFYYAYQFSKMPNINIHGYLGKLAKHEKLINRIEKVLFN